MPVKKILVTGSSGTVGTRLCEKLLEKGYEVQGADVVHNKWSKKVDNVTKIVNLLDGKSFGKLGKDFDMVIHLAANARVYNLVKDPSKAFENFQTLFNALEFCRKNDIKRFIFSSSREVYGNSEKMKYREDEADVRKCESPYTASKIGGEALIYAYEKCYGVDPVIVRFSNVYGMYDESDRVVPLFIRMAMEDKPITVFGKEKELDFTYIDDAIDGVLRCIERFDSVKGGVYNIASGKAITIEKVAEIILKKMKKNNRIILKDNRTGEVEKFVADTTKAEKALGHKAVTGIEEGLEKSIQWYGKFLY